MNIIDSIISIVIISIVIVGITIVAALYLVKQKKLKGLTAFELFVGCWLMIAAIVWLATVLQLYGLKESKNVWDIASIVFTFLGTILTAGTAIAGITALLSYMSINEKLKKAEQDLNSAQEKLTEFQELHQHSIQLKQQIADIEKYQVLIQDLDNTKIDDTETNQAAELAAEQILKSDYSQFEHRLKARAILDGVKAKKQFDEIIQNPSADAWQQNITARGEIMDLWQLVYQGSNSSNRETNQENYASAVYNYGRSYTFASKFHQDDKNETVYLNLVHQASKQYALALQINPNLHKAANNWAIALNREANALPYTELTEKRRLWKLAREKYALALQIRPDNDTAANNWRIALNNEANALPDTEWEEKFNLWRNALNKVQNLQSLSDEHQQSSVLQKLVNQIERKIANLEKRKPLS